MSNNVSIGGQAVTNGVMISSSKNVTVAVRRGNGEIIVQETPRTTAFKDSRILQWPFFRGIRALIESVINGRPATDFSKRIAEEQDEEPEEESEDEPGEEYAPSRIKVWSVLAILLALAITPMIVLPRLVVWGVGSTLGQSLGIETSLFHIISDVATVGVFLIYLYLIGRIPYMRTTFEYHGAEHKAGNTFEADKDLTVENARNFPSSHPRCGTSFLVYAIILSIVTFSLLFPCLISVLGKPNYVVYIIIKLLLVAPIICLAYEFHRFINRHTGSWWAKVIAFPGILVQKLSTRNPDDSQIEVGLAAVLQNVWREAHGGNGETIVTVYKDYSSMRTVLAERK